MWWANHLELSLGPDAAHEAALGDLLAAFCAQDGAALADRVLAVERYSIECCGSQST